MADDGKTPDVTIQGGDEDPDAPFSMQIETRHEGVDFRVVNDTGALHNITGEGSERKLTIDAGVSNVEIVFSGSIGEREVVISMRCCPIDGLICVNVVVNPEWASHNDVTLRCHQEDGPDPLMDLLMIDLGPPGGLILVSMRRRSSGSDGGG